MKMEGTTLTETSWTNSKIWNYLTSNPNYYWITDNSSGQPTGDNPWITGEGNVVTIGTPKVEIDWESLVKPEMTIDQIINMGKLANVPSLKKAVDELTKVIARLVKKYNLNPLQALALHRMLNFEIDQAIIKKIQEAYNDEVLETDTGEKD
jgi:hypothetical protein